MKKMKLTISEASEFLGVSIPTLRRWEKEGRILSERTEGNHRRYDKNMLMSLKNKKGKTKEKVTIGYCRVSSSDQKDDLKRQKETVSNYCAVRGYQFRIIEDIGSGLNYNKKGLNELIELISERKTDKIVVNYKDRLIRYGYEMLEKMCEINGVQIEIINHTEDKTYEEELVEDVLSIITVFSSRLYGSRSRKARKIQKENKRLFQEEIKE